MSDNKSLALVSPIVAGIHHVYPKRKFLPQKSGEIRLSTPVSDRFQQAETLGPDQILNGKISKPGLTLVIAMAPVKWDDIRDKNDFINLLLEKIANQSYQ